MEKLAKTGVASAQMEALAKFLKDNTESRRDS